MKRVGKLHGEDHQGLLGWPATFLIRQRKAGDRKCGYAMLLVIQYVRIYYIPPIIIRIRRVMAGCDYWINVARAPV